MLVVDKSEVRLDNDSPVQSALARPTNREFMKPFWELIRWPRPVVCNFCVLFACC
jgi:hypothetical protein